MEIKNKIFENEGVMNEWVSNKNIHIIQVDEYKIDETWYCDLTATGGTFTKNQLKLWYYDSLL
jgi:hypothetical protein